MSRKKIVSRLHVTCSTKESFSRCTENYSATLRPQSFSVLRQFFPRSSRKMIVMISSQPSEQYGFTTLFLFLLFLNSDIGIVILYIVKYIRKAFSLPKKINFEVQNLTNIHVFRFAFSDLYCYHTDLQNARNAVSDNLIFKISRGACPRTPLVKSASGARWSV